MLNGSDTEKWQTLAQFNRNAICNLTRNQALAKIIFSKAAANF